MLTGLPKKDEDSIEDISRAEICARDLKAADDDDSDVESIGRTAWDDDKLIVAFMLSVPTHFACFFLK